MDPIQKAIERARLEKEGRIGQMLDVGVDRNPDVGRVAASGGAAAGEQRINVTYSQTRVQPIGQEEFAARKLVAAVAGDKRGEAYRQLRTQLLQKMRERGWNTLAVVSPNDGAGATLVSVNLAVSIAREYTSTVMLVDMDLSQPSVAKTLGLQAQHGLLDFLEGKCELQDALIQPGVERLVVLPGLPAAGYSSEVLTSPEMKALFKDLKTRYESRIVLFDMPAILRNDDAIAFLPKVDAVLLVVEEGGTRKDDLKRALQLLEGCNIIGTVLNKVREE